MNKKKVEDTLITAICVVVCLAIIMMMVALWLSNGALAIGAMLVVITITVIYALVMAVL